MEPVEVGSFLKAREERFTPVDANKTKLRRISKIDFSGNIVISDKTTNTGMILVKPGDLVISGINVEKGALSVYEGKENILATIHYSSYEYDKTKININYLKWFLKSPVFRQTLLDATGRGIKTELKPKRFLSLKVYLPDLKKQIQIVDYIKNSNQDISSLESNSEKQSLLIENLRRSILQDAAQGNLVRQNPKDEPASELIKKIRIEKEKLNEGQKVKKGKLPVKVEKVPFELPKSWEWVRLIDIIKNNPRNGLSKKPVTKPTKTKSLTLSATSSGFFRPECFKYLDEIITEDSYLWLKSGDILIQRANSREYVGIAALFRENSDYIYPDLMMKISPLEEFIVPEYLHFVLNAPFNRNYYMSSAKGASDSMPKINQQTVSYTYIPLPPYAEQIRIVEQINLLMKICDQFESKVNESRVYSERLMEAVLEEVFKR